MTIQGLVSGDGVKLQKINDLLYPGKDSYQGSWCFHWLSMRLCIMRVSDQETGMKNLIT